MKNKNIIIGIVVVLLALAGFFVYSNIQKQKLMDENQTMFDEFEAKVISGDTTNCESTIDESLFPEVIDLESLCYFNKAVQVYESGELIDSLIEFDNSLAKSDKYTNEINEYKTGIELLVSSSNINTTDQLFKFDMENEFSFFNDMMAFVVLHPFNGSDDYLINNQYIAQIVGFDNWTDGNVSFRFYAGTLYSDIERFNNGDASKVFFSPYATGVTGWNVPNEYGVIMMEEESGNTWSWEYRYNIVDLDTIIIYSMITNTEYTLVREIK